MVTGFKEYTHDLNKVELELADEMKDAFLQCLTDEPTKSDVVEYKLNCHLYERGETYKVGPTRLRKWVNHMRSTGALPILANQDGYFLTYNKAELEKQVQSLDERANSIRNAADGLRRFLI